MASDPRVDAYLATLPPDQRKLLQDVRAKVARYAPDAQETISYGMPAFKYNGSFVISFAGWKKHCSIYPLTDAVAKARAAELQGYERTKGSLHFTPEKPLPDAVLQDVVNEMVAAIDRRETLTRDGAR